LNNTNLNPIDLVCGDIKNRIVQECVSVSLEEIKMFCEKLFAEYTRKIAKLVLPHEKVTRGILALR
jgi:hypothetical protein